MNYLAHAYLSFHQPPVLVGNLISDFVKGKKQFDYPAAIRQGITLHRAIDQFTDEHPATKAAATFFKPHYRLYSAAFVDVVYDHFLATHPDFFTPPDLLVFSREVYQSVDGYTDLLPPIFARMFPYMKEQNWLYHYQERQGIANSFEGLVRRAVWLSESYTAFRLFEAHYPALQALAGEFLPQVKQFARQWLDSNPPPAPAL
ncbi:MAG: ACP phosphodiesterase [Candidatus Pseudobacter hemicellulosilyticus]|uniref:ACP phosphodiesterase n=1 Tax=Candidatus Pseudobacter hemicellulosilyticus TaxID=3121375 RepID=A0AAJ5WYL4_9BACT|nr:MAG: ACP phosphodiesterase [Pseudobacter sp.]